MEPAGLLCFPTRLRYDLASLPKEVWERGGINRETMIVRRGNDSSAWNNTAGAWNKARGSWIALLQNYRLTKGAQTILFSGANRIHCR